ncbi:hypothetical protein PIB30_068032 [Stylosanthes scabra]|uniref:Uncharacterized protein n=1 Tax=Stylosanthes scabra TaxID=79078 RepID=A0ABU6SP30_9FABA|nr:hypothetical protein [Stylosanthes scabra]
MRKREERGVTAPAKGKVVAVVVGATRESEDRRRERETELCVHRRKRDVTGRERRSIAAATPICCHRHSFSQLSLKPSLLGFVVQRENAMLVARAVTAVELPAAVAVD